MFIINNYVRRIILSLVIIVLFAQSSHAATVYSPITGNYMFTQSTDIIINSWNTNSSAIYAGTGQSVSVDPATPGIVVSIDIDIPMLADYTGIYAHGANSRVSLDKVYINAGDNGGSTGVTTRGVLAENGSEVNIGDNSEIYANSNGVALASTTNANINVGDGATLYGTVYGENDATVMADGGSVTIGHNAVISNDGYNGFYKYGYNNAVFAVEYFGSDGSVTIGDNAIISIGSNAGYNRGLQAGNRFYGRYGVVTAGDNATIEVYGDTFNYGLYSAASGSVVTIGADSKVITHGTSSYAVFSIAGGHSYIGKGSTVLTDGNRSGGLVAHGSATVTSVIKTSEDVTIESRGISQDHGVWASGAVSGDLAEITLGKNNEVITNGESSLGLYANRVGAVISADDGLRVATYGSKAYAVDATQGAKIYIGKNLDINTSGDNGYGLVANGSGSSLSVGEGAVITTGGGSAHAVYAASGGVIDVAGGAEITVLSNDLYGLVAYGGNSQIHMGEDSKISALGDGVTAVYALDGGTVELRGTEIEVGNTNTFAVAAESNNADNSNVTGSGIFNIKGNIAAETTSTGSATVDLTMQNNSLFTGMTGLYGTEAEVTLSINGANSLWDVTDNSELTNLYLSGSTVDLTHTYGNANITMANLGASASDAGTFKINTDIVSQTADMLIITESAQGNYLIDVKNEGSQAATGTEVTNVVRVVYGQPVGFALQHTVENGGWQYGLHHQNGTMTGGVYADDIWSLQATGKSSNTGSAAVNNFAGSYLMTYATTQTLIQRMGDLRASTYGQGLWFRAHGGKFESNSKSYVRGFDMKYGGVQIGYDRKIETNWNGRLYTGAMFEYAKGDLDYSYDGSGSVDSKAFGVYGTFIANNGWYVDTVLKYQWMDNDFEAVDTAGTLVKGGEISTGGFGASVEVGKRIHFGETKERGSWYVEPQLQLSFQHHDGGYFNADNGLHVGTDSFNSLLGRAGVLVGYEAGNKNFYAKVSRVKEFDGDLTVRANGVPADESFSDSWWVYGLGFTSKVNDRNSLYIDVERTSGGSFRQPWRINGGWRVEF